MDSLADLPLDDFEDDKDEKEIEELDSDIVEVTHEDNSEAAGASALGEEADKKKTPLWRKPQKKKGGKKGGAGGGKQKVKNSKKKDVKTSGDATEGGTEGTGATNESTVSEFLIMKQWFWSFARLLISLANKQG